MTKYYLSYYFIYYLQPTWVWCFEISSDKRAVEKKIPVSSQYSDQWPGQQCGRPFPVFISISEHAFLARSVKDLCIWKKVTLGYFSSSVPAFDDEVVMGFVMFSFSLRPPGTPEQHRIGDLFASPGAGLLSTILPCFCLFHSIWLYRCFRLIAVILSERYTSLNKQK